MARSKTYVNEEKTQDVSTSAYWLLTSGHHELDDRERRDIEVLKHHAYDWCLGREQLPGDREPHYHFALQFDVPVFPYFGGCNPILTGWNVQCAVEDVDWEGVLEYTKKGGEYEHKREVFPVQYVNSSPEWRPWQKYILDYKSDDRTVICVIDTVGGCGKTFLSAWHAVRHLAVVVPPLPGHRDIMRMIYAQYKVETVYIDIPRAMTKKSLSQVYSACESIKDGVCYDDRYQWLSRRFNSPKVVVFSNVEPDTSQLSIDRWLFVRVLGNGSYIATRPEPYDPLKSKKSQLHKGKASEQGVIIV